MNLKVEVRACGIARIAAQGDELPLRHRAHQGAEVGIGHLRLVLVLIAAQGRLDARRERLQVTVDRRLPRWMGDVYGIAEAIFPTVIRET
jgi:hypothetical protein